MPNVPRSLLDRQPVGARGAIACVAGTAVPNKAKKSRDALATGRMSTCAAIARRS